jgi:hypothetical protein
LYQPGEEFLAEKWTISADGAVNNAADSFVLWIDVIH